MNKSSRSYDILRILWKPFFFRILAEFRFQGPDFLLKSDDISSRDLLPFCCIEILALSAGPFTRKASGEVGVTSCLPLIQQLVPSSEHWTQTRSYEPGDTCNTLSMYARFWANGRRFHGYSPGPIWPDEPGRPSSELAETNPRHPSTRLYLSN